MVPGRDPFVDGLRCVGILRVVALHTLLYCQSSWIAAFSFLMPGMPIVFFVSGALAAKSLTGAGPAQRRRFWTTRGRRLLMPYWAFGLVVVAACLAGDAFSADPAHEFGWSRAWAWVLPLVGPRATPAFEQVVWHLWFLSSLLLLLASAPWTLGWHRRFRWCGALAFALAGAAIELAGLEVPGVVLHTLLFGSAFQLGYGYLDGSFDRLPRWALVTGSLALGAASIAAHARIAPGTMIHTVTLAYVGLGMAFLGLWIAFAGLARRLFALAPVARLFRWVQPRAYTIYLWGPIANLAAWELVRPEGALGHALYLGLSTAGIVLAARLFGWVEVRAAGRGRLRPMPAETARRAA